MIAALESRSAFGWTGRVAYAFGLIATDGFLTDSATVGFSSTDVELVELLLRSLSLPIRYTTLPVEKLFGNAALGIKPQKPLYFAHIYNRVLFNRLIDVGIGRRKSLTLGSIDVPDVVLFDFVRGLLDGDGSVMKLLAAPKGVNDPYRLHRLRVAFYSGSRAHLEWLRARLLYFVLRGSIHVATRKGHSLYHLIYSDRQAHALLSTMYQDPRAPRLTRKWSVWRDYCQVRGTPDFYGYL